MTAKVPMIKGASILPLVKLARTQRAAFEPVLGPELRTFIETRILGGSWYPTSYHRDLIVAADRVLGKGDLGICRAMGRQAALKALQETYRPYLVPGNVGATLGQFAVFWPVFHDTGRCVNQSPAPGHLRIRIEGFGLPSRALCLSQVGWLEGLAEAAGGRCEVEEAQCAARGDPVCVYDVRWSPGAVSEGGRT